MTAILPMTFIQNSSNTKQGNNSVLINSHSNSQLGRNIRLYELKGMHLDFVFPFFFISQMASPKITNVQKLQKTFSAQQKMTYVAPRGTWTPSNFLRKNNKKALLSDDDK